MGAREGICWFSQSREVLDCRPRVRKGVVQASRIRGPHFWSSMEASTADFLQGKLDD